MPAPPSIPPAPASQFLCVCDANPEAEGYILALRRQGYTIAHVEQSGLIERAHEAMPSLVLFDVDAPGALDAIRLLRALPEAHGLEVLAIGAPGQTLAAQAEAVALETSGQILRPVDPNVLVLSVETLIGAPPSWVSVRDSLSSLGPDSLSPSPASEIDLGPSQKNVEISEGLAQLLQAAEEHVVASGQSEPDVNFDHDEPKPELIPPEALHALRQPLGVESQAAPAHIDNLRIDPRSSRRPYASSIRPELDADVEPTSGDGGEHLKGEESLEDELTRTSGRVPTAAPTADTQDHEHPGSERQPSPERATVPPPRREHIGDLDPERRRTSSMPAGTDVSAHALPRPTLASISELPKRVDVAGNVAAVGRAVQTRFSGALAFETARGIRRAVFKDGDLVTAVSGNADESLVGFLASTGQISTEDAAALAHRLPPFGRHTGTALIARGQLKQEQLWPTLRGHAEWLLGRALSEHEGTVQIEHDVPERLAGEPTVFGGATGAEVLIDTVRRVIPAGQALAILGGEKRLVQLSHDSSLLSECALSPPENDALTQSLGLALGQAIRRSSLPDLVVLLLALHALGVIQLTRGTAPDLAAVPASSASVPSANAQRARIIARKALVDEGDYFAVLGVSPAATAYDIERSYQALRSEFEPSRILTAHTIDLTDDVTAIVEVLDEAYEILKDHKRCETYRRAITATTVG